MIVRINADTAGRALRELHESRGMSRRAFAKQLAQLTMRDPLSVNEQLYEWCRPEHVNGRYPNMMTYETALNALGLQLAIVPVEAPDKSDSAPGCEIVGEMCATHRQHLSRCAPRSPDDGPDHSVDACLEFDGKRCARCAHLVLSVLGPAGSAHGAPDSRED